MLQSNLSSSFWLDKAAAGVASKMTGTGDGAWQRWKQIFAIVGMNHSGVTVYYDNQSVEI